MLDRWCRTVDVAPTLAAMVGVAMPDVDGAPLDLVAPQASYVVGLLWDGAHPADLYDMASRGALPAVAQLLDLGCALRGGAIAEFPSVTLVNHTSALTGVSPHRHGVLNNAFYDRRLQRGVVANISSTWHRACDLLRPEVRTLWEVVAEARPDAVLACIDEPVDRGATYSTFALVRQMSAGDGAKSLGSHLPAAETDPHATQEWVACDPDYAWSTQVDALGLQQMVQLWGGDVPPPLLTWWNTTVTDTGHHGGGPFSPQARASLLDSDRRLGVFLDLLNARGLLDDTAFLLTADHGCEGADPDCRGDWDEALRDAGIAFRDEAYGFLYLGDGVVG